MIHNQTLSYYLSKPNPRNTKIYSWSGFRTNFVEIRRENPRLLKRAMVGLLLWSCIVGSILSVNNLTSSIPSSHEAFTTSGINKSKTETNPIPVNFASDVHATTLPGGPTGDPLPPGTTAPDNTYPNSYARGQCTWYVASRRQIPSNWGNAVTWYYHAISSGWQVGTTPAVGAVAWTNAGHYGHVALVEHISTDGTLVQVSEMNYRGVGVKSFRWASSKSFKYIY